MEINFNNLPEAVTLLFLEINKLQQLVLEVQSTQNPINPHERLTRKEVTQEYKICYATVHNLINQGRLRYEKIGRKTLFRREDLEECFRGYQ